MTASKGPEEFVHITKSTPKAGIAEDWSEVDDGMVWMAEKSSQIKILLKLVYRNNEDKKK